MTNTDQTIHIRIEPNTTTINTSNNISITPKPFPFEWWEWLGTIIGWISGFLSPLFWIIALVIYIINYEHDKDTKFFSIQFKRFVAYYGIGVLAIIILMCIAIIL